MVDGQENPQGVREPMGSEGGDPEVLNKPLEVDLRLVRRRQLLKGIAAGVPAIITLQSGAALAANSVNPQCVVNGPVFTAQPRCVASGVAATSRWIYKIDTDATFWVGADGPCTNAAEYGAVYVNNDGIYTTATPWGGASATNNAQPAAGYYAITKSCWSSFFYP